MSKHLGISLVVAFAAVACNAYVDVGTEQGDGERNLPAPCGAPGGEPCNDTQGGKILKDPSMTLCGPGEDCAQPTLCCDHADKPKGLFFEGIYCCYHGQNALWVASIGDGPETNCGGPEYIAPVCEPAAGCCDPADYPAGPSIEGADCCADGQWAPSPGDNSACDGHGGAGEICER